jgi:hypothetical protein
LKDFVEARSARACNRPVVFRGSACSARS